jgi:hypothetical protein
MPVGLQEATMIACEYLIDETVIYNGGPLHRRYAGRIRLK